MAATAVLSGSNRSRSKSVGRIRKEKTLDIARPTVIKTKKKKTVEIVRIPIHERKYKGANIQLRAALSENYEGERSLRESWWRPYIRETPIPGSYGTEEKDSFITDLAHTCKTYSFKSDGRRLDAQRFGKGAELLPGNYEYKDLAAELENSRRTYTFKNTGRDGKDLLNEGIKDKNIDVSPDAYDTAKYLATRVRDPKNKNYTFKSATKRFPTVYFNPKEGPAPGAYEAPSMRDQRAISSSFRSATPRFKTSHTRIPGPGMYEPTFQSPQSKTIQKMGRLHGLFFSCSFQK